MLIGPLMFRGAPDSQSTLILRRVTDDDFGCHWGP